jgi:hypothetical protein
MKRKRNFLFVFYFYLQFYIFSLLVLISQICSNGKILKTSFHYEKKMQLSSKLDVCEVRALQMRNGLYRYTLLCKELLFCKQKQNSLARSLGEESAHKRNFFSFVEQLHQKLAS